MNARPNMALVALAFLTLGLAVSCGIFFPCDDKVITQLKSPDGSRTIIWFVRDCGATTDFATHVALRQLTWLGYANESFFVVGGQPSLQLDWKSNTAVTLSFPEGHEVFRKETVVGKVKINYEEVKESKGSTKTQKQAG